MFGLQHPHYSSQGVAGRDCRSGFQPALHDGRLQPPSLLILTVQLAGTAPGGAVTFFCRKESNQRNLPPAVPRYAGCPALLAVEGPHGTRYAQTTVRLIPPLLRCSARQTGERQKKRKRYDGIGGIGSASASFPVMPDLIRHPETGHDAASPDPWIPGQARNDGPSGLAFRFSS